MEQKKTLWIIAAVGVFLLVVLGAPAILHYPSRNQVPAYASIAPVEKKAAPTGWSNTGSDVTAPSTLSSDISAAKVNDLVVLADNATVYSANTSAQPAADANNATTIDLNTLKNELLDETASQKQPQNINITVNIPENKTAETKTVITPYTEEPAKAYAEEKSIPVKKEKPVKTVKKAAVTKATGTPAVKEEPKKTQFWVQVAAYSNKKGAEGARSILDENKIPADIFTYRDNKDKLYYRVRVGPYTTKSEAEYWRTKIIKINDIDNASDSYITSTTI